MFDIGWSELLVIGVVALIVVGPKDLPRMFRTLGEATGKARKMAREFQSAMNDAAKDSGMDDVTDDLRKLANPKKYGIDKLRDATGELSAWSPDAADGKARPGLPPERTDSSAKIAAATAARAQARLDSEAAELSDEPELLPDPAAPKPAAPKAAAPKTAAPNAAAPEAAKPKRAAAKSATPKRAAPEAAKAKGAAPEAVKPKAARSKSPARKPAAKGSADPVALEPVPKSSGGAS